MADFGGLLLFGIVVGLVICAAGSLCYCGVIAVYNMRRREPMANHEQ